MKWTAQQKVQMQGARVLRNEVRLRRIAVTKDEVQRRRWTFLRSRHPL